MQGSFDDTKGSLAVQQCATEQSRAELEEATQRTAHYLALGAAGALLAYLQQVPIPLPSIKVWQPSPGSTSQLLIKHARRCLGESANMTHEQSQL